MMSLYLQFEFGPTKLLHNRLYILMPSFAYVDNKIVMHPEFSASLPTLSSLSTLIILKCLFRLESWRSVLQFVLYTVPFYVLYHCIFYSV